MNGHYSVSLSSRHGTLDKGVRNSETKEEKREDERIGIGLGKLQHSHPDVDPLKDRNHLLIPRDLPSPPIPCST